MKNKGINVLSFFDGMSCGQIALKQLGIKVNKYYSAEIDKPAIQQTQHNFKNTIQIGSVTNVKATDLENIDLFIGGSPCQGFSFAGKQLNFNDPRSALFFEFIRVWKEVKAINPAAFFMLENVNMKKEHLRVISEYLGVFPVRINSNLVSAQNRDRWYWTNIRTKKSGLFSEIYTDIPQPKDKGLLIGDILQPNSEIENKYFMQDETVKNLLHNFRFTPISDLEKKCNAITSKPDRANSNYICVSMVGRRLDETGTRKDNNKSIPAIQQLEPNLNYKSNCLTSVSKDNLLTDCVKVRRFTPLECARLQTIPDWYEWKVSNTQIYKMLGNGWTVDVIAHIFSFLPKNKLNG